MRWGSSGRVLFFPSIAKGPDNQSGKLTSLKAKQSSWPFVNSHAFCGLIFLFVVQLLSRVRLFVTPWTLLLFLKVIPVLPEVNVTMDITNVN